MPQEATVREAPTESVWNSNVPDEGEFEAGLKWVHDRVVEEPWVVSKALPGERVLDVGSATSRYLTELPSDCKVYAIDLRPSPGHRGIAIVRGNVMKAPFRPACFDAVTCISTVEHMGCYVYGQFLDRFGDEVAMRYMRSLLRPGGRLLLTVPFGNGAVYSWLRVYNRTTFGRLIGGYRPISLEYYRRDGEQYMPCERDDLANAGFDSKKLRADGLVLAELTPSGGLPFLLARLSLRLRRLWHWRTQRNARFWQDMP